MFNYFIVQELLSLLFLAIALSYVQTITTLTLIAKAGLAPLHYWLVPSVIGIQNNTFVYTLTLAKLPTISIVVQTIHYWYSFVLTLGCVLALVQLITTYN